MGKLLTEADVRGMLRDRIQFKFTSQKDYAECVGVTPAYVCAILKGKKSPAGKVLKSLGLKSVRQTIKQYQVAD